MLWVSDFTYVATWTGRRCGFPGGVVVALLLFIMGLNFVAMLFAVPIMRVVGLPILQLIGWVFSALQAGLAVAAIVTALRNMQALA